MKTDIHHTIRATDLPAAGIALAGGYFTGTYRLGDQVRALIAAPAATGDIAKKRWMPSPYKRVLGEHNAHADGRTNTLRMAELGSKLAKWALEVEIDGHLDWYVPAIDELEILYRVFKPGEGADSPWLRSGVNATAIPPTYAYSIQPVLQTSIEAFRGDGSEAFKKVAYWSSTQDAVNGACAWAQYFSDGYQDGFHKGNELRVRLVRSMLVIE